MWGQLVAPSETVRENGEAPRLYRCTACDVFGKGSTCWMCGKAGPLEEGTTWPRGGFQHHSLLKLVDDEDLTWSDVIGL